MQVKARVLSEPLRDVLMLVRRVVVEDQMDLQPGGDLRVDRAQELQELRVTVARQALPDDVASQDVQRGEQRRRAVALVVMSPSCPRGPC
jgi:hypothetical protein